MFEGLPVRGMLVRLTDGWQEVLRRRAKADDVFPEPVRVLMGEMAAAGALMQANIKFNGALVLQIAMVGQRWMVTSIRIFAVLGPAATSLE